MYSAMKYQLRTSNWLLNSADPFHFYLRRPCPRQFFLRARLLGVSGRTDTSMFNFSKSEIGLCGETALQVGYLSGRGKSNFLPVAAARREARSVRPLPIRVVTVSKKSNKSGAALAGASSCVSRTNFFCGLVV